MAQSDPPFERLVAATDAIELLAREHDRRGTQSDWASCLDAAHDTILARLLAGYLIAYAEVCEIDCDNPAPPGPGEIVREEDFFRGAELCRIPLAFWCHYSNAGREDRKFDFVSGDFSFSFSGDHGDNYRWRSGGAYAAVFDRNGLPAAAVAEWPSTVNKPTAAERPQSGNRGRPPANWWPDFAEELAIYVHDHGMPDTQETLISSVQAAMTARERAEPSRAQIQPVIRALFDRLRPAGK